MFAYNWKTGCYHRRQIQMDDLWFCQSIFTNLTVAFITTVFRGVIMLSISFKFSECNKPIFLYISSLLLIQINYSRPQTER